MVDTKPDGIIPGFVNELQFPAIHCMVQIHPGASSLLLHATQAGVLTLFLCVSCVGTMQKSQRGRRRSGRQEEILIYSAVFPLPQPS